MPILVRDIYSTCLRYFMAVFTHKKIAGDVFASPRDPVLFYTYNYNL